MTIKDGAWQIGQTVATNVFCVFSLLNWHLEVKLCASQCREHQMDIKGWPQSKVVVTVWWSAAGLLYNSFLNPGKTIIFEK